MRGAFLDLKFKVVILAACHGRGTFAIAHIWHKTVSNSPASLQRQSTSMHACGGFVR